MSRPPSRQTRQRPGARRAVGGLLLTVLAVGAAGLGVAAVLERLDVGPVTPVRCAAEQDGTRWYLEPDQAETAALLSATTVHRGMPARAATIALATGLQESKLRNIDYGDRDSVGIFQQRPSQGWGTVEQILDPVYSTNTFLDALARVDGYEELEITVAAQRVQRSGFPDAYAQHETRSRAWASGLTGWSAATVTCDLREPEGSGDPAQLTARVQRDFAGTVAATVDATGAVVLDGASLPGGDPARSGWAVAHWAVAVAEPHHVVGVEHADRRWDRAEGAWGPAREPVPAGQVRVTLAD
ncbi:hypothetical protein [Actinotalea sp. Marseille-Q4924]|uniref:hypothetical protein n=1 Tax=Actinotalea sp. Marseille-Q4924 TaxID=2866571 RepID=UPI001CE4A6CA|nr:hypothetical protein [Actinotalea sp. Marseille-Q4924]